MQKINIFYKTYRLITNNKKTMIYFPNAKINIGLFVTGKRDDGFHNIESVFYPIGLNDALEMRISQNDETKLYISGENIENTVTNDENNTVLRAFNILKKDFLKITNANICLDKRIPVLAGLGGGSSDATYMLKLTDYMFELGLSLEQLHFYASQIGSDCPFFIQNTPQFVYSRGEKMISTPLNLSGYYLVLIKPNLNISTKEAYREVNITKQPFDLRSLDVKDIKHWKDYVRNDFEMRLFEKYPLLSEIKKMLYNNGALYSQMSGSGSTIYGIFSEEIDFNSLNVPADSFVYQEKLQ